MQYYPIVRRLYLLYGFLTIVRGQSSAVSTPHSISAIVLTISNVPVSSSSPEDTSIAASTASTISTSFLSPDTPLSNTDATTTEQASSTTSSQTERDTFSSLANSLALTISTTSSSTTITSPTNALQTSEASSRQVLSSESSLDRSTTSSSMATTFSDTHLYQSSQSQTYDATNTAVGSNSDPSASTTSQPGATGTSSASNPNYNILEVDSDSSTISSRNALTTSTFTSEESSIPTTSVGLTTSTISAATDRLSGSNTQSASSAPSRTSDTFNAFTSMSSNTDSDTILTSLISATSTASSFSADSSVISTLDTSNTQATRISSSAPETTTSDVSMTILNAETSTEYAATSTPTDLAATSTGPAETSTESTVASSESVVASTDSAVASTESTVAYKESTVASTESAVASTESTVLSTESRVASTQPTTSTPVTATLDTSLRILIAQTSTPTDLAATSTESTVASTESVVASTDSAVASTESVVASTDSAVASTESTVAYKESTVASTESAVAFTESTVLSTESTVAPTESRVASTQPTASAPETTTSDVSMTILNAETSTEYAATSTPTDLATTSTGPAETPTESTVAYKESTVASTESAVASTESAVASTESAVASTESAVASTESAVASTESTAAYKESTVASTESTVASAVSTVASTEPTASTPVTATLDTSLQISISQTLTPTDLAATSTGLEETSTDQPALVFTLTSTPITSTMSVTSDTDTFISSFPTFTSESSTGSLTEVDITAETSLESSNIAETTNTAATITTSSSPEPHILTYTLSPIVSSSAGPVALSTSETATGYSSLSQDDATFTASTPAVSLDSFTNSMAFPATSESILTSLTSSVPSDASIFSTGATKTQDFTASTTSQTGGSLLETSTFETASILVSSSLIYQDSTSSESLHEKTSAAASMPMSSPSSTDQQFSVTSSESPTPVQKTTLTYGSSSPVYFSSSTQKTSAFTNSIIPEDSLYSHPSSLVATQSSKSPSTVGSHSSPAEAQNSQSTTSSTSDAPTVPDTIGLSQTTSSFISSQLNTISSPNFQSAASSYSKETLATISSLPETKQTAESPSSTNASPATASTTLAPSKTIDTTDSVSSHWLPTAIVVQSSLPSTYSSTFNPSVTATLPHIIAPPTSVVPVANSTIITVGFKVGLNYEFLVNNPLASAQIFSFLPSLLVYPFQIDDFQELAILFARANYCISSQVQDSTTILSPEQLSDAPNNYIRDVQYASVNVSSVKVIQIVPLVVSGRNYLISVAEIYFPSDYVSALQTYVLNLNSSLYNNPSQTLSALADLMDPSISLTGLLDSDGYANGNGNAGNSGGASPSNQAVAAPQNGQNNDAITGSLETSNSTSHIAFSITKRLLIYLTCFASGTLLWILLILFVYKLRYGKNRIENELKPGGLHMFYEKQPDSAIDIISVRSTNSTIHTPAINEKGDFPKNETGSTGSELQFEMAEDLIVTGENTVYSTVHGLEYFVDEDGSFYYAGAVKSTHEENEPITEDSGYTENINNYLYSANEERSAVTINASSYDIGSLEVDEDGNFVLPVTSLQKELGGIETENSDTVESYNNNHLYKLRKTLLSDEVDNNGNIMSSNIVGGSNCTNSDESSQGHVINDNLTNIANGGNNSKKNISASSNSDSNGLIFLPMDVDNFDEYMYQERDEHFQDHLDVEIDDIDDDHVADVQIDELDELDEEMYKRLSKIMTQNQNTRVASNLLATRTNSNTLDNLSASTAASIHDLDAKDFLQKRTNAVHNGELKNVKISTTPESNSLGW